MKPLDESLKCMTELVGDILKRKSQLEEATAKELSDYIAREVDVVGLLQHILDKDALTNGDKASDYCSLLYTLGLGDLNYNSSGGDYDGRWDRWELDRGNIRIFLKGVEFARRG